MVVESLSPITKAEWKENNSNEDIAFNIYTLLISSIECHSRLLIAGVLAESAEHRNLYMRLIHEILQCTDKPGIYPVEESCSILAMGFWYMLQDEVLSNENVAQKTKALELIGPLYSHLTLILVRKAQQPDELSIDKWNADDLETFRCYRQDISDTLVSAVRIDFTLEWHKPSFLLFSVVLPRGVARPFAWYSNGSAGRLCGSYTTWCQSMDAIGGVHLLHVLNCRAHRNRRKKMFAEIDNTVEWNPLWEIERKTLGHSARCDRGV